MTDDTPTRRLSRRAVLAGTGAAAATTFAGCSGLASPGNTETNSTTTTASDPSKNLHVSPGKPSVGDSITIAGASLPANTKLTLKWQRVTGHWAITQHSTVSGVEYTTTAESLATVTTNANGQFSTTVQVPEDHGGSHNITAVHGGSTLAKGSVHVTPTFKLDRTSAPLGEEFTLHVTGMPRSKYRRDDQVLWDNEFTGLVTGVTNKGTVRAKIPAAGPPGTHVLEVGGGYEGATYLNPQQSPYPRPPRYAHWAVTVTKPTQSAGYSWKRPNATETPNSAFYPDVQNTGATLSASPTSGIVGSTATIDGSGFSANESVTLQWLTMTGSRVSGNGFTSKAVKLTTVTTDGSGSFSKDITVPDDLGGTHPIVAHAGGKKQAVGGFVIRPSIVDFGPTSGPVGTPFMIHLKGVGWTEYDNIYAVTYDNAFEGYGCGFNTGGDVQMQFRASGEPGLHTVNCFPAIYKKPSEKRQTGFYTKPQLTYLDDHPVRPLPEMEFLFKVTQ